MVFESWENKNDYIKQVFAVTPTDMYFTLSTETLRSKKDFDDNVRAYLAGIDTKSRLYSGFSMENVFYQTAGRVIPMVYTYKSQSSSVAIQFVFLLDETYLRLQMSTGDTIGTLLIVDENGKPVLDVEDPVIKQMFEDDQALSAIMASTKVMEKFALSAYGCCEDLTKKIPLLKRIKNLRRIAVSPFADVAQCAEQIGNEYIVSYRPNPATFIARGVDEDFVRGELSKQLHILKQNDCYVEVEYKDVETVNHDPNAMGRLVRITKEELEKAGY